MDDAFEIVRYQKLQPCLVLITLNQSILGETGRMDDGWLKNWASNFWIKGIYLIRGKNKKMKAEIEKEVEYDKVKWSKNVKG